MPASSQEEVSISTSSAQIKRILVRNTIGIAVSRFLSVATALVISPVTIHKLGMSGYGVYETMIAISSVTAIFQGGVSASLLKYLAADYHKGDYERSVRLIGTSLVVSLAICLVAIPILLAINPFISHAILLKEPGLDNVYLSFNLLALSIALQNVQACYISVISATQRTSASNAIVAAGKIIATIIALIGVLGGYGILGLALGEVSRYVLTTGISAYYIHRIDRKLPLLPSLPGRAELREVYTYGGRMFIVGLTEGLSGNLDKIVLGFVSKFEWAGYYGIATRLVAMLYDAGGFIVQPLIPATAALWEQKQFDIISKIYLNAMRYLSFGLGFLVVVLIGLEGLIQQAWLNTVSHQVVPFLFGLSFATFIQICTWPGTAICRGVDKVQLEVNYSIISVVLNALLTLSLVLLIGAFGTVIATVAAKVVSCLYFFILFHKTVKMPFEGTKSAGIALAVAFSMGLGVNLLLVPLDLPAGRLFAVLVAFPCAAVIFAVYTFASIKAKVIDNAMISGFFLRRKGQMV